MNARYQEPGIGRFISQDPVFLSLGDKKRVKNDSKKEQEQVLENPQLLNSYSYAGNNPLIGTDPDGKYFEVSVSGTAYGGSGALGVRVSTRGINVFASGGAGGGVSVSPLSFAYSPGDISHRTEVNDSVGASGSYFVGYGRDYNGRVVNNNFQKDSVSNSLQLGLGFDVYARREISIPILGSAAPEGLILDPNPSPYSTPNYIVAPQKDKTLYISNPTSQQKIYSADPSDNTKNNEHKLKMSIKQN